MNAGDLDAIALAERVLSILEEGGFSATYKLALFTAILDLCIEKTSVHGSPPDTLTTRQLADKVVELYWNHVTPYGGIGTLRQGGGHGEQATIVSRIERARAQWADAQTDTPYRGRQVHPVEFRQLVDFVEWKLIEMPVPRLQVLGRQEDRFLYQYNWPRDVRQSAVKDYQRGTASGFDNRLLLRPRVAEHLVRLNGILRPLFHRAWAVMVARMNKLPEAELERFLFGSERTSLEAVRGPLRDLQNDRCFYCDGGIGGRADVDHFIPWSRYPDNGLDNLVAAHPRCNNSKRDFLAAADHVERWVQRTHRRCDDLHALARDAGWPRDTGRTGAVAAAIYLRLPASTPLWRRPDEFVPIERERVARALTDSPPPFSPRS
jgi:HNH endonuclease